MVAVSISVTTPFFVAVNVALLHLRSSSCCVFSLDDGGAAATAWWCRRKANLSLPPLRDWPPALTRSRRCQRRDDEDDDSPPVEAFLGTCHGQASRVWAISPFRKISYLFWLENYKILSLMSYSQLHNFLVSISRDSFLRCLPANYTFLSVL